MSMEESDEPTSFVVLGRIGAPFGIQGFVHVQSFTEFADDLLEYDPWHIKVRDVKPEHGKVWKPFRVLDARKHGKGLVARLEGCENREDAQRLTNLEIGIERDRLPDLVEGDYYWVDLIGLDVINEEGVHLGKVKELLETGANDVLVVWNDEKDTEYLIPYVPEEYILKIDLEAQQILVHWGLDY